MGREERIEVVLRFMAEHGLALPPKAIYRNLRLHHNATFSERSTLNYLQDLADDGYLQRVEPEQLEDRKLVEINTDEGRAYYFITDKGKDEL